MKLFDHFWQAREAGRKPALLEFAHPLSNEPLLLYGIDPSVSLEVRDGRLYRNKEEIGAALDIFDHLKIPASSSFLPAWIGFFSYEFCHYFGRAKNNRSRLFPDAFFRFYDQGFVINGKQESADDAHPFIWTPADLSISPPDRDKNVDSFRPLMEKAQFFEKVQAIKERIRRGDVYQVNLSLPFFFDTSPNDMLSLYQAMRHYNPSPFMGLMEDEDWWLLSGSPERLFSWHDGQVSTRPIAGTKARKSEQALDEEQVLSLRECPKENAEHAMLVDLLRNDLNLIALTNSVSIDEDRSIEFYSHVMHLVSKISCQSEEKLKELMRAIFPGGTITGAPKASVIDAIAALEDVPRGPYTGSLGYISGTGSDFNIIIRSVLKYKEQTWINAGAGIVIDSDEESEWLEINKKAQSIKDILAGKSLPKPKRSMIQGPAIASPALLLKLEKCRVTFIENQDSFSFNIIDVLKSLGASVRIAAPDAELDLLGHHLIIGPGPGNVVDMPHLSALLKKAVRDKIPTLGICLGHQAIAHHFGASIIRLPEPMHGKVQAIKHQGSGIFNNLANPCRFTRYHSLVVAALPPKLIALAHSPDEQIMAIRHQSLPIFGVQFHPESYLSEGGRELLYNFLRIGPS